MTTLQQLDDEQVNAEVPINENFETVSAAGIYGKKHTTTSGLTWGFYGGRYNGNTVADGTVTLTDDATNYLVILRSTGVVSVSTATTNSLSSLYARLYKVTTVDGAVTDVLDERWEANGLLFNTSGTSGTVTSVAASVPSFLSISGSPITSSGTLAITYSGTALPVANGGTGGTSAGAARTALGLAIGSDVQAYSARLADFAGITYAQGDVFYHNGSNIVKLAAGTNGHYLQTQGAGANPQWAAVSGNVATDAIWDAAGDIAVGSGANTAAKLTKGADGDVLSVVAGAVAWAAPAAAGSVATDAIWDAAGDLAVGSGANTAAKLTKGSDGDVLSVVAGAVAWAAPASSGGTKTYAVFTPMTSQPPASNFASPDVRNSIAVLDFDAGTQESAFWVSVMPEAASLGSGLKVRIHWMATTATSGDVVWGAQIERMNTDLDSDSFDTAAEVTSATNGTSGIVTASEITITTIDSVAAGELFRLKIYRKAADGADTMTGDAELVAVELRSAA
jgi:hypothetical protein